MHYLAAATMNRKLQAAALATPLLMASGMVPALELAQVGTVAGLAMLFIGALRFHVAQGQRSAALSRFLSPNVARLINRSNPVEVLADSDCEISIVSADIRNFTRFSSDNEPAAVMQFLREYYDAVGAVVTAFGGTVKDYAGDGIVVLVGAPLPAADHADRAVRMARAIREAGLEVTSRWSREKMPLSIGVGVASGTVTVGVLGGSERMEYAAVGPAVNLASRLCANAGSGEILVDSSTRELARQQRGATLFQASQSRRLTVKGFETPVESFSV